ncbi:XRE family transcriptional regulator [Streptomyces sp. WAC01280]|uniref:XRE family transcriptional regulator n=1 Tax=Streptomyces sp. WAC01280 TaxID=2487424 RepID=UPI000F7A1B2C|nr:XRE family transcriptional regulator [Streptomyces sp. WAC01280]RSS59545.1 XRE family transcriptional regulator [Streptomyces sp. WAC01280]
MYDRTDFIAAAHRKGDRNPSDTARRLKVARNTAWRTWHGLTAPSAPLMAAIHTHYGMTAEQLLKPKQAAA